MIQHGKPPYLECSSRGDRRFSAFCAKSKGRIIEDAYQSAKVFEDGSTGLRWHQAKGRYAVNQEEVAALYAEMWDDYIGRRPALLAVLCEATGLSDFFGTPGSVCQATELWRIRCAETGEDMI